MPFDHASTAFRAAAREPGLTALTPPWLVQIVTDLPKTPNGDFVPRTLRDA